MPSSSDSPKSRAERRRLAREAYKRSMRKSGGQPGHEGKSRELVSPERVDKRFEHEGGLYLNQVREGVASRHGRAAIAGAGDRSGRGGRRPPGRGLTTRS